MNKEREYSRWFGVITAFTAWLGQPALVSAHEVYVLPKAEYQQALSDHSISLWTVLHNPHNLVPLAIFKIALYILTIGLAAFWATKAGRHLDNNLQKAEPVGQLILRVSLALALLFGASQNVIFGPELLLSSLPVGVVVRVLLVIVASLTLLGWLTELAAVVLALIFGLVLWTYGAYGFTYLSYFGEILALMLFGGGWYSLDRYLAKVRKPAKPNDLEILIIRALYGFSLLYAAISIKLLHPALPLAVVRDYHLTSYSFFPSDPLLLVALAAAVELVLGFCIMIGFQTRLFVMISLFFYIASLIFFGESVWPHLILFGMSAYLLINNGGAQTADSWLMKRLGRVL